MAQALTEDYGQQFVPGARVYLERIVGAAGRMDCLVQDLLNTRESHGWSSIWNRLT